MYADALVALLAIVLFAVFFYGPWQEACTDVARQVIFEKRDRLFDLARAGKLDFQSHYYRDTRKTMEGMIRFAHRLTWTRLLYLWIFRRLYQDELVSGPVLPKAVDVDPETEKAVRALVYDSSLALIGMMTMKSVVTAPVSFIAIAVAMCTKGLGVFRNESRVIHNLSETVMSETAYAEAA